MTTEIVCYIAVLFMTVYLFVAGAEAIPFAAKLATAALTICASLFIVIRIVEAPCFKGRVK